MSQLPKDYKRLVTSSDKDSADHTHWIRYYQNSIKTKFPTNKIPPAYQSLMSTTEALLSSDQIDDDGLDYTLELLARLDHHLDTQVSAENKALNDKELHRLLNQKLAYIFDRDVMNALIYSAGIAVLASIALLTAASAVTLTLALADAGMSLWVLLIFALLAMCALLDNEEQIIETIGGALITAVILLCIEPVSFVYTSGIYTAACAIFTGVFLGTQHCVNEITFSANNYKLRSDASALINTSIFANNPSEQADLNSANVESPNIP
jgi:hypothetical protein